MAGAINFAMTDIYGGIFGTTEQTIPEANDQKAIVDDKATAETVTETGKKKFPIVAAVILFLILAFFFGKGV